MFSLLVTIISIALVAALALATLYYGGDIFNQGADRAQAAKIAAQGQQVMGALELYHAEHGVYPNTLADLVTTEYLKSIPVAFAPEVAAVQAALAAGVTWTLAAPGQPVIALTPVTLATCKAYNAAQFGIAQVLRAPHEAQLKSCYGASESTLTIIQAKSSSDLVFVSNNAAAPLQIGPVVATPLPAASSTDVSLNGWLIPGATAPVVAFLDATGTVPLAALSFADTSVGATSAASTVTVKNTGTAALAFNAPSALIAAPFAISANTCSGSLAPNATCTVSVTFVPTAAQAYTGGAYALQLSASNLVASGLPAVGTGTAALLAGCPLSDTGAGYLTNLTTAPVTLTMFNGDVDGPALGLGLAAPYYFTSPGYPAINASVTAALVQNEWWMYDGIAPWTASSVRMFAAPVVLQPGASLRAEHLYGGGIGWSKIAVYAPTNDVWCAMQTTYPYGGPSSEATSTLSSWTGSAWAAPGTPQAAAPVLFFEPLAGTAYTLKAPVGFTSDGGVTLSNPTTAPLTVTTVSLPANTTMTYDSCTGSVLQGSSCSVYFTYAPDTVQSLSGTVSASTEQGVSASLPTVMTSFPLADVASHPDYTAYLSGNYAPDGTGAVCLLSRVTGRTYVSGLNVGQSCP